MRQGRVVDRARPRSSDHGVRRIEMEGPSIVRCETPWSAGEGRDGGGVRLQAHALGSVGDLPELQHGEPGFGEVLPRLRHCAARPEDVRARIRPYHSTLRHELERYGGTVEKFIGDAVMAVFGAPVAHEDDPERAVRAGLRIIEAIAELNERDPELELQVRVGINTGPAVVALHGRPELGEGIIAGDVVNTAARIQAAAPVDGIAVSDE